MFKAGIELWSGVRSKLSFYPRAGQDAELHNPTLILRLDSPIHFMTYAVVPSKTTVKFTANTKVHKPSQQQPEALRGEVEIWGASMIS